MKTYTIQSEGDSILYPKYDNRTEIFKWSYNGKDNQLPSIIQHLALESVTAASCIKRVTSAIFGKGFEGGDLIVNKKGETLNDIGQHLARELATQNNAFIHLMFTAEESPKIGAIAVEPASRVRIGSSDDVNYSGKFCVADWASKRIMTSDIKKVDRFNSNENVIKSQVVKAGGVGAYKGQMLHISMDGSVKYAPSAMYPVLEDAEAEKLSKIFTRNNSKFGFMNSKAVLVPKMEPDEERSFKNDLQSMQGAENASNLLVFQASNPTADLEKQIILKDLSSNPNDKVLEYSDQKVENNICKAFRVPVAMVSGRSEGIFGNSGELLREMKVQLYEDYELERMALESAMNKILKHSIFNEKIKQAKIIDPWQTTQL